MKTAVSHAVENIRKREDLRCVSQNSTKNVLRLSFSSAQLPVMKLRDLLKKGSDLGVILDPLANDFLERLGDVDLTVLPLLTHHEIEPRVLLSFSDAAAVWVSAGTLANRESSTNDPLGVKELREPRQKLALGTAQLAPGGWSPN